MPAPDEHLVPLRTYLEDKLKLTTNSLKDELCHLREDLAELRATSTEEHAEVRADLKAIGAKVDRLAQSDLRDQAARDLRRTIWRASGALVAAAAGLTAAAAVVISWLT